MLGGVEYAAIRGTTGIPAVGPPAQDFEPEGLDRGLPLPPAPAFARSRASDAPPEPRPLELLPIRGLQPRNEPIAGKRLPWAADPVRPVPRSVPSTASSSLIERIVDIAPLARSRGETRLRFVLQPAHLGALEVELLIQGSVLNGRVRTHSPAARDLLVAHLGDLLRSLEQQGIRVGEFQVSVDFSLGEGKESGEGKPRRNARKDRSDEAQARLRSIRPQTLDLLA